ncbi:Cytochrome P450 CYP12A2 [Hondaea fermentalgiana]|uniref:Cytochrome P450 CYP12A2 n=1 Tax=Hondaea fermentalgiana TaxID=2315210 RepID=A0A2R5GRU6_9STRA|nr:Cytochrome P450 CYP12A2 [Hondaea fermentalgiana]|eukprot:GBG33029.1 Cytochrome P450 CYP12A2 [Hondaea fermentalgiana]
MTTVGKLILTSVQAVLPVFLLMGVGGWFVRREMLDQKSAQTLSFLVTRLFAPALYIVRLGGGLSQELFAEVWVMTVMGAVIIAISAVMGIVLTWVARPTPYFRKYFVLAATFTNYSALPLAFLQAFCASGTIRKPERLQVEGESVYMDAETCQELGEVYLFLYTIIPSILTFACANIASASDKERERKIAAAAAAATAAAAAAAAAAPGSDLDVRLSRENKDGTHHPTGKTPNNNASVPVEQAASGTSYTSHEMEDGVVELALPPSSEVYDESAPRSTSHQSADAHSSSETSQAPSNKGLSIPLLLLQTLKLPAVSAQLLGIFIAMIPPLQSFLMGDDTAASPFVGMLRLLAPGTVPAVVLALANMMGLKLVETRCSDLLGGDEDVMGISKRTMFWLVAGRMIIMPIVGFALLYAAIDLFPKDQILLLILFTELAMPTASLVPLTSPIVPAKVVSLSLINQFVIGLFTLTIFTFLALTITTDVGGATLQNRNASARGCDCVRPRPGGGEEDEEQDTLVVRRGAGTMLRGVKRVAAAKPRQVWRVGARTKATAPAAAIGANVGAQDEEGARIMEVSEVKGPGWRWLFRMTQDPFVAYSNLYNEHRDAGVARIKDIQFDDNLVIFNQDDVKHVMQNEGKNVAGSTEMVWALRDYFKDVGGDVAGNHPLNLTLKGERWRETRRLLSPGIYTEAVASYEPLVQSAARQALSHIETYAPNDLEKWAQYTAFDMFAALALGENIDTANPACTSDMKELVDLDETSLQLAIRVSILPWFLRPRNGYGRMKESFDRILEITQAEVDRIFDQEDVPKSWFKDLRDEQGLTRTQLVHLMGGLLSAGVGTTMGLIQWGLVALAFHPDEQAKVRAEIMDKLGDKPFTQSIAMPYLEAFIRESERVYTATTTTNLRKLDHDIVLPNSRVRVPAGTRMQLAPTFATRDTAFNPDADEFKPERYLRENIRARKGCPMSSKMDPVIGKDPFGGGARVCLGKRAAKLELRTILCEVIRNYELVLDPVDQEKPKTKLATILLPNPMPKIKLVLRPFGTARPLSTSAEAVASKNEHPQKDIIELSEVEGPGWWWLLRLLGDPNANLLELYEKHREQGVARTIDTLGRDTLVVFDQDDCTFIMQHENPNLGGSTSMIVPLMDYLTKLGGDNADNHARNMFWKGEMWRNSRSLLSVGINSDAVVSYEPLIQEGARLAVSHVEAYENDIPRWAQCAAFDMFTSLLLGQSANSADPACDSPLKKIIQLDQTSLDLAIRLSFLPKITHPWNGYKRMEESLDEIMEIAAVEVKAMLKRKEHTHSWFKDLHEKQGLTEEQLIHLIGALLPAGLGTTMGFIQWNLVALIYHPEAQTKLRAEILDVLGDKPFTKSAKMPYMEAFFKESHRMYPAAPVAGLRILDRDIVLPNSRVLVRAGQPLNLAPLQARRDKRLIPDADEFKPERYLRENIRARKGCPMTSKLDGAIGKDPFGRGGHVCLGRRAAEMEVRTLFCELLRRYELVLDPPGQSLPKFKIATIGVPDPFPRIKLVRRT